MSDIVRARWANLPARFLVPAGGLVMDKEWAEDRGQTADEDAPQTEDELLAADPGEPEPKNDPVEEPA